MDILNTSSVSVGHGGSLFIRWSTAVQTTELELSLHVYISQVVGMTEVTDVIFVFFKTNLLYIIFFISFVQINFLNLVSLNL